MRLPKPRAAMKNVPRRRPASRRSSEERFRTLVEHLPVGVYRTFPDGRLIEANPALVGMLGFRRASDLLRHNVRDFYVQRTDRAEHLRRLGASAISFAEFELRGRDGRRFWVRDHPRAVPDEGGKVRYFDGLIIDISERKKAEARLRRTLLKLRRANEKLAGLSVTDELTGVANRRGFFTQGQQLIETAARLNKPVFMVFIDLDGLKKTNDTYGHPAGDAALRVTGRLLRETLRASDIVGRLGGDEFAVLAVRNPGSRESGLLRRLKRKLAEINARRELPVPLSLSTGVSRLDGHGHARLEEFVENADRLMYDEKRRKRRPR
jgi:diguanylate cyclase (GGDEF)-like protein/PAS domain S-box-containing protein